MATSFSHALVALALGIVGCTTPSGAPEPTPDPSSASEAPPPVSESPRSSTARYPLELGESVELSGLTLTFEEVLSDGRCPTGVECVWVGEARVRLLIDGVAEEVVISGMMSTVNIRRGDVELQVLGLAPYPVHGEDQSDETRILDIRTRIIQE